MKQLTQKQREVYEVMLNAMKGNKYSLGVQFIADRLGLGYQVVIDRIIGMRSKWYITVCSKGCASSFSVYRLNCLERKVSSVISNDLFQDSPSNTASTQQDNSIENTTRAIVENTIALAEIIREQQRQITELIEASKADKEKLSKFMEVAGL